MRLALLKLMHVQTIRSWLSLSSTSSSSITRFFLCTIMTPPECLVWSLQMWPVYCAGRNTVCLMSLSNFDSETRIKSGFTEAQRWAISAFFPLILFTLATTIGRLFTLGASNLEPVELPGVLAEEPRVCCELLGWACVVGWAAVSG